MALLSDSAASLLARCCFPPKNSAISCAVSGGKDSLALLVLAVAAGCDVTAYHVDHRLREGSAGEADLVRAAADALGTGFVALTVECPPGPNLEARARKARFEALPDQVATGHTADDQAETILLNFLRGSGLDGLSGMRPGLRHPILGIRRAEAAALVDSVGLTAVSDPSNDSPRYRRNRVRHELVELMSDIAERDLVPLLCRQAEILREEASLLDGLALELDPTRAANLSAAPRPLARRALRRWLSCLDEEQHPPSASSIERVLQVAAGDVRATEIEGGRRVKRTKGILVVEQNDLGQQRGEQG